MPQSPLLQIQDLTRRDHASGRVILDRVSMTIDQGERIGLVGPSGSGKSSLLRALARLDLCDHGTIRFRDAIVTRDLIPGFRRQFIYLPQRPSLMAKTVRENLEIPFRLAVSKESYDESIVANILSGLARPLSLLDQSAESLSGGEQQIIALIRAMILRPTMLLLDEPSASLDPATTQQMEQLVLDWHQQPQRDASSSPRALVWTSHNPEQIARMSTRVVRIDQGILQTDAAQ